MAAAASIEVPILDEDLILSVVKNVANVNFTTADLKNPTHEKMYSVYSGFICSLLNVSNEQITQVPIHVLETISHPELCIEEAAGSLLFIKALEYLFNACCINNFTMNDVVAPTRKRTRKLLSAIVNFTQFMHQNEKIRTDMLEKVEIGMIQDVDVKVQETLKTGQSTLTEKRANLIARIAELKAQRLEKQHAVKEMNLSALKAKQQEIAETKEQKEMVTASRRSEVEELHNVLTVTKASKLIRQAKEAVDDHLSRGQALAVKEKLYTEWGSVSAPSLMKLIQGINENVNKVKILTEESEQRQDRKIQESRLLKDITTELLNVQRMIQSKTDKKQRFDENYEKKMKQQTDQQIKRDLKQKKTLEDISQKNKEREKVGVELKKLTEEELLRDKEHKELMRKMQDNYTKIEKQKNSWEEDVTRMLHGLSIRLSELEEIS